VELLWLAVAFVVVAAAFLFAERVRPARAVTPALSRRRLDDWAWWPFSALVTGNLTRALTFGLLAFACVALGYRGAPAALPAWLQARPTFGLGRLPMVWQFVAVLALGDLVNYWNHRLRHTRALWRFHAVHHSPTELDWLSSVRMHPVDDAIDNVLVGAVVLAAGAQLPVWLATGPFLLFFDAWLHANLRLELGPLEYLIATPSFHRWHHADERGRRACNFAGVLPLWDLVFGTFYRSERAPAAFGSGDPSMPQRLLPLLAYPLHRSRPTEERRDEAGQSVVGAAGADGGGRGVGRGRRGGVATQAAAADPGGAERR
jgi:sterol desaturase/sphingolipid hydroxylase (fatty acid hydroxylase superfamily)